MWGLHLSAGAVMEHIYTLLLCMLDMLYHSRYAIYILDNNKKCYLIVISHTFGFYSGACQHAQTSKGTTGFEGHQTEELSESTG